MVNITEELVRKRAEHNNCEIFSLEELSLHQQDLEKIEHLDKWCRDLKILYLQNNLIGKIENVSKLKKLEYLNLALNNIERIENLQECESLKKLDLTVNFIGELTSLELLKKNLFLEDLYLTGNPCTQFEGYEQYVIASLPQLKRIDGNEIEKSGRIKAIQNLEKNRKSIVLQQEQYMEKRIQQKKEAQENIGDQSSAYQCFDDKTKEEIEKQFWSEKVDYTPETRTAIQNKLQQNREMSTSNVAKTIQNDRGSRRLYNNDGQPMNINEAKVDFKLTESDDEAAFILDVGCWKYLDTSLIDADVQPWYVRVTMKGAVLQLSLVDEVKPDSCIAQRSQATGHLIITMPKLITPHTVEARAKELSRTNVSIRSKIGHEFLDVKEKCSLMEELSNIRAAKPKTAIPRRRLRKDVLHADDSPGFIDDPEVPPLTW